MGALELAYAHDVNAFVEVGAQDVLTSLAQHQHHYHADARQRATFIAALDRRRDDLASLFARHWIGVRVGHGHNLELAVRSVRLHHNPSAQLRFR